MINIKTYILHYKKLSERKNFIEKQFKKYFSNYEYYEDFDKDELTDDLVQKCYNPDKDTQFKKLQLWSSQNHGSVRLLNPAEISVSIKHGKVIELISKREDEIAFIFEDDVVLCEDFETKFNEYFDKTPKDFDVVFIGSGANLKPHNVQQGKVVYKREHPASRCADSYLLSKKAATQINSTYFPFSICSDWELAYQMYAHNQTVYWWEPSLVLQGSEHGLFKSTLR